jgi:integrase/recombinase XerD
VESLDDVERDIGLIRLGSWGRVAPADGVVSWQVLDRDGRPVEAIGRFLRDFVARGNRPGSVRSYAYDLLRWWRFLLAIEVEWDKVTSTEVRDFVLWLQQARKPRRARRTKSVTTAGRINPVTRKQHLDDRYTVRTVRHGNAVLRSFYDYWIELGEGPLVNPVPREQARGGRAHAHHNPLESFQPQGRLRYNPKLPKRRPRALSEECWKDLFAAMRSNRDRALLALAVSAAARAAEILGGRGGDLDWGDQLVRVRRKGTQAEQWLPASSDAFVWLRLYLDEIGGAGLDDPVWQTLRRRDRGVGLQRQPLNYDALRAVLRRANELLGSNWTMLSRPGARFRCFHRPVSPGHSPNPPCRSLGNGLSTVSAVKRVSWVAMGLGSCCPGSCTGRPVRLRSGSTRSRPPR